MPNKSSNTTLRRASKAKYDEFYTQQSDIEKELKHYKDQLKGKVVYCNCDDPFESNFFKYFATKFNDLELKKLITTSYKPSPFANTQLTLYGDNTATPLQKGRPKATANKFIINEVHDIDKDGAFDLRDVAKQLIANRNNEWEPLRGDGDFRSPESINLLKQADIVVTNPPFSLFREYVAQLIEYRKKFLIIGTNNAIHYKEIFPLIKNNELWLGYNNGPKKYLVPSDYDGKSIVVIDGQKYMPMGNTSWFTNLDTAKRHEMLTLYKTYSPISHPKYDNFEAIEVSKVSEIPLDYTGAMGVPDTFLDKYNPDQFELLGIPFGDLGKVLGVKKNYRGRTDISVTINGKTKCPFSRIIIKAKRNI